MSDDLKYPFATPFELDVLALLVRSTGFYSRFAEFFDDELFPTAEVRLALKGARLFYNETQRGPGGESIVIQRLMREHDRGLLSMDNFMLAIETLESLPEDTPDETAVSHEFSEVLKRRLNAHTLDTALMTHATRGDMSEVARQLETAASIGDVDLSVGDSLDTLAGDLKESGLVERLSFGCWELDQRTGGGRRKGEFGFHLAPPKTGKSAALVQDSIIAVRQGLNCLAVTLELPSDKWRARHLAGLTGTPMREIVDNPNPATSVAFQRYQQLAARRNSSGMPLGKFLVKKMPAGATSLIDVLNLVDRVEQYWGEPVHALVVDYMGKMRGKDTSMKMYEQMLEVFEGGRLWAEENGRWVMTASQAKGHVHEGDMPTLSDCADSQNKVRVTDWMTGLQKHIDEALRGNVSMQLLAGRNYEETEILGPFPRGFPFGVFFESVALDATQTVNPAVILNNTRVDLTDTARSGLEVALALGRQEEV